MNLFPELFFFIKCKKKKKSRLLFEENYFIYFIRHLRRSEQVKVLKSDRLDFYYFILYHYLGRQILDSSPCPYPLHLFFKTQTSITFI